jgi:hypothetical protein
MLNWNPLWPLRSDEGRQGQTKTAAPTFPGNGGALFSPASLLEYQAYFWSQLIDANRNFWSMCAAAFPGIPAAAAAAARQDVADAVIEPAAATHAVEDLESVLESQTRFWNHMLDANRNLWTGMSWNMPDVPLAEPEPARTTAPRTTSTPVKRARPPARKHAATKSKTQRAH